MRIKTIIPMFIAAATLAMTGCTGWLLGSEPYREVRYYSLRTPEPLPECGAGVKILSLQMLAPAKSKMLYHDADGQILIDDFNKWIQPPSFMLRQYFQTAFSANPHVVDGDDSLCWNITGSVIEYAIDIRARQVVLGMSYRIQQSGNRSLFLENTLFVRKEFSAQSPEAYAAAMSEAAGAMSRHLLDEIVRLNKSLTVRTKGAVK